MVEERIRHIMALRRRAAHRLGDGDGAAAAELVDPTLSPPTFVAGGRESPSDAAERAFNLFDLQAEARLPAPLRMAYRSFGNALTSSARRSASRTKAALPGRAPHCAVGQLVGARPGGGSACSAS